MKFLTLLLTLSSAFAEITSDVISEKTLTQIAFGSCNSPRDKDQSIYGGILQHDPQLFLFLGDNIYGDTEDMTVMQKKYQELADVPGYQKLQAQTEVLATWDDHDYGVNDGGNGYIMREESKQVFLDFFKEPADSVRRERPGIYASYSYGKPGQRVQVLLLDTRSFKDDVPRRKGEKVPGTVGWYDPQTDTSKTLLGEAQWAWLDQQLQVPAEVRIIASSVQVLAHEKRMENWGNFPHERQRLYDLLRKHKAHCTFAISGDVHFTELSKTMIGDYPFYDLTSSGMTHTAKGWANAKNTYRVGKSYWDLNAGLIEIDWENASLTLSSINPKGERLVNQKLSFTELQFN